MKRVVAFPLFLLSLSIANADYKPGYYDDMDGTMKDRLKEFAKRCVENHTKLNYTDLPNYWVVSDVYPDMYDGCLRFWDMYSDNMYLIFEGQTGRQAFSANKMQREHLVPKSWWKKGDDVEYTPAYSDMWNLYPSDGPANQAKNNYPLGPVQTATFDNGVSKIGSPVDGYGGGCSSVFEPSNEYKGDFARAVFYMATVYDGLPWRYTYMFKTEAWPTLQSWAYNMLLDWARQDPVSEKEIKRNDAVEECQSNRNPFIDFPDLCEYVWGDKTSEIFYIADHQGGVEGIDAECPIVYELVDGSLRIIKDSDIPVIVTDIAGRILLRVMHPRNGDIYSLPSCGLMLITSGSHAQKVLNR